MGVRGGVDRFRCKRRTSGSVRIELFPRRVTEIFGMDHEM
ncbi:predicted protein [Streptomyces sp. SPB78]|nr:predicted protein [Streptomyces sp. SPB78]